MTSACNMTENRLQKLITGIENEYKPLFKAGNDAYWIGTLTGSEADFEKYAKANLALTKLFSDPVRFAELKQIKEEGRVSDPLLQRQLDELYNHFLGNQADPALLEQIINKESALEQKYASFRAVYRDEPIDDNQVEEFLRTSYNSYTLKTVWEAHKAIGPTVAKDIIEVVKLRNKLAQSLGFENYHSMSLQLSGEDPQTISDLMDELDALTRDSFNELKEQLDSYLAVRYGCRPQDLRPWHYQNRYFQEAPNLYPVDLDKYYKDANLEELTSNFYKSIGLDITKVLANSDLYPRNGKNQHAFCADMDSEGDIRVLCNIVPGEKWMGTMLHEFGHAVYALGHDNPELPIFLRDAAQTFTTEAIAMLFGRLSSNPNWIKRSLGISDDEANAISEDCAKTLRLSQLVCSRWYQVMYRFEKSMYANPDQDLNKLWWDLVEQYQGMKRPENRDMPDWATKIHIALYPCYYHNYQLGEVFASQLHYYIVKNVIKSEDYAGECYVDRPEVGKWLNENIFTAGKRYPWNEMIERATGEKLTAKYFQMQFCNTK